MECNAAPDPARPQYIVGYSSLIDELLARRLGWFFARIRIEPEG